jgi:mannose-6-phosphate isomerase-like protein (cupin superfamily)
MASPRARVVRPNDGEAGSSGTIGVRFMIDGADVQDGGFALVDHPMPARRLAAPLHRHSREDEYSYVLRGRMGAMLGDDVLKARPGDLVFKPRNQWHTFWNAGDEPALILELIAPAGFEEFFRAVARLNADPELDPTDRDRLEFDLASRYGLEVDPDSDPGPLGRFGLTYGEDNA